MALGPMQTALAHIPAGPLGCESWTGIGVGHHSQGRWTRTAAAEVGGTGPTDTHGA